MELYPKNKIPVERVKRFIVIFYCVGVLGFIVPFTKSIFIAITPFALLLNTYLLAIYHKKYTIKAVLVFLSIFSLGYTIEVIGVKTGLVFGSYSYDKALGFKLFETPLMIGVNWLFLTYAATTITDNLKWNRWLSLFVAPALMLVYDFVLEMVAPKMDMWTWQNSDVPVRNYIAWYLIALFFVLLIRIFKIDTKNPLSATIFICQFMFFILLTLLL